MISPGTITSAFCVLVVISNAISGKLIPFSSSFMIPAGLITYPLTFLLSDLMTELHGAAAGRKMVYCALLLSCLSYGIVQITLWLPSHNPAFEQSFQQVMGLNGWIVLASLSAFIVSQILDVQLYAWIHRLTGDRMLWLRNNGSTLLSQIVDTALVNGIYLRYGMGLEWQPILQVMLFAYFYKAFFSIAMTPLFYGLVRYGRGRSAVNLRVD